MTWQEIYNKYKDTELMKEFREWCHKIRSELGSQSIMLTNKQFFGQTDIKDIWGYLICFAETIGQRMDYDLLEEYDNVCIDQEGKETGEGMVMETAMLWCADKFFEIRGK